MSTDIDTVGWFTLELMSEGPDEAVHGLPTLGESNFNLPSRSGPGLIVKVHGDLLGKLVADITELPGWGLVDGVGVLAMITPTGMDIETTKRNVHPSSE